VSSGREASTKYSVENAESAVRRTVNRINFCFMRLPIIFWSSYTDFLPFTRLPSGELPSCGLSAAQGGKTMKERQNLFDLTGAATYYARTI
jgi:hypothetical protein